MSNSVLRVAIVGGGASGAAVATHLADAVDRSVDLKVDIFDPGGTLGRGIAYSTTDDHHLLNVPAKGMSLFRDDMAHFQRWAGALPDEFISRAKYGDYLQASLRQAWRGRHGKLGHIRAQVSDVVATRGSAWVVLDENQRSHEADVVVLATGHQVPTVPQGLDPSVVHAPGFFADPWSRTALADIQPREHVLCIGTGLTFVDVALTVLAANPYVTVTGVSRSGRLPARHLDPLPPPVPPVHLPTTLASTVAHIEGAGDQWRCALDGLRAHTPQMWQRFLPAERAEFIRAWGREWDIHRHRMAPVISDVIFRHREVGRLRVLAAPEYQVEFLGRRFVLGTRDMATVVDRVILCTGPGADVRLTALGASVVRRGIARPGPFDIGYDVQPTTGEVIGAYGTADNLFTMGPLRRGVLFESTAMPEISAQAQQVAQLVSQRFSALVAV